MALLWELRRRFRHIAAPLAGVLLVAYFAYHSVQGEHGFLAWVRIAQQLDEAKRTLAETGRERRLLERHVALLRPDSLDPDMLDEQARRMLNLAHRDEWVFFYDRPKAPSASGP
jgi:cell division protein FtsB